MQGLSRRAFTFIELMLTASIFAIVAVSIYSTFRLGLFSWRKSEQAQQLYLDVGWALDRLAIDLENAIAYYPADSQLVNFAAEQDEVSFYSQKQGFDSTGPYLKLTKITYRLDESGEILQRLEQSFAESEQSGQLQEPEELCGPVAQVIFFYYYENQGADPPYKWQQTWEKKTDLPRAVKVELGFQGEEKLLNKYIFIPQGVGGSPD